MKELTEKEWKIRRFRMVRNTILIAIPSIIAVYYMLQVNVVKIEKYGGISMPPKKSILIFI